MNRTQKTALFRLFEITLGLVVSLTFFFIYSNEKECWLTHDGKDITGIYEMSALDKLSRDLLLASFFLVLIILTGELLRVILFWRKKKEVVRDERDLLIYKRCSLISWMVFWAFLFLVCMIFFLVVYLFSPPPDVGTLSGQGLVKPATVAVSKPSVPVILLPVILLAGGIVFMIAHSIAILACYSRGLPPRLSSRDEAAGGKENE